VREKMVNDPQAAFDAVGAEMAGASVTVSKMFGVPCLKIGRKAFAGLHGDAMFFKLRDEAHAGALALPGARLFDPMETGRAMREWVHVPAEHAARWPDLARDALAYVASTS
jgi:hypothetical protein